MEIAILMGGSGSRLKKIIKNRPKSFLHIGNQSIIERQIKELSKIKKRIFLLSNTRQTKFNNLLKNKFKKINLIFLEEDKPLGNGGC